MQLLPSKPHNLANATINNNEKKKDSGLKLERCDSVWVTIRHIHFFKGLPVINHNGKEYEKNGYIYIYETESL